MPSISYRYKTSHSTGKVEKIEVRTRRHREDWFRGVAPSDLSQLDDRQLYENAVRLWEALLSGVGTPQERANLEEAYHEVIRERWRRPRMR